MASIRRLGKNRFPIVWLEGHVVGPDGKRRQRKRSGSPTALRRPCSCRAAPYFGSG